MDYRDTPPQHRGPHNVKWTSFAPPGWTNFAPPLTQRRREMFVPLTHPPGHAQVDFGEALAVIGGVERKIH